MHSALKRKWTFRRDERGVAAVEMALIAPILMVMLLGMSELALRMRAQYKAAQTATTVADMIARYQAVTASDVKGLLDASSKIIGSSDFATKGVVILSSASKSTATANPKVAWRCKGGGSFSATSKIGNVGSLATLPGDLALDADDNVIIAEVFYNYEPGINFIFNTHSVLYNVSTFRPRLGALTTAPGC